MFGAVFLRFFFLSYLDLVSPSLGNRDMVLGPGTPHWENKVMVVGSPFRLVFFFFFFFFFFFIETVLLVFFI